MKTVRMTAEARLKLGVEQLGHLVVLPVRTAAKLVGLDPGTLARALASRVYAGAGGTKYVPAASVIRYLKRRADDVARRATARGVSVGIQRYEKLGYVYTTTVARQSCPESCPLRLDGGCYAEGNTARQHWDVLTDAAEGLDALDLARAEAAAIDRVAARAGDRGKRGKPFGPVPMRLHVAGDCSTPAAAELVAAAAMRYTARTGGPVWTYTHAWRVVPRAAWGRVAVLASCERPGELAEARARGYAAALVVEDFGGTAAARPLGKTGFKVLPCPAMTKDRVTCESCRLCFSDARLRAAGLAIGFAVHGPNGTAARAATTLRSLPVL